MSDSLEQLSKSQLFDPKGRIISQNLHDGSDSLGSTPDSLHSNNSIIDQKYKIIGLLGEGGMGAVYKAHHLMLNKDVALKTFRSPNLTDDTWQRFQREAQAIARLSHINIVQVFDFGVGENNVPYYTMECLTGESLADRLAARGPLPLDQTMRLFLQVCQGLSVAHSKGIIHRDIKPANIFLTKDTPHAGPVDLVKIVDFGIAGLATGSLDGQKLTTTGSLFGSPLYMSPEQSLGDPVTERSDIYSCGCTLFETLTGSPPFRGENAFATMLQHQTRPVPRLDEMAPGKEFPQRVDALIDRMLAKSESQRFQSFAEVAAELEEIAQRYNSVHRTGQQESAPIPVPEHALDKTDLSSAPAAGSKLKVLVAAIVLLLVGGLAVYFLQPHRTSVPVALSNVKPAPVQSTPTPLASQPQVSAPGKNLRVPLYLQNPGADNAREPRRFSFPNTQSLGKLTWHPWANPKPRFPQFGEAPAAGVVTVPPQTLLDFEAGEPLSKNPELFKGFGANDFNKLGLAREDDWGDQHLAYVSNLVGLRFLNIEGAAVTDSCITSLNKLTNLTGLEAAGTTLTGDGLVKLKRLKQLQDLDLGHIEKCAIALKQLTNCPTTQVLKINCCKITDDDMNVVATLPNLFDLDVNQNPGITDNGVRAICRLQKLKDLNLFETGVTAGCIDSIKRLPALTGIVINYLGWSPEDQARLLKPVSNKCRVLSGKNTDTNAIGEILK
jgi:serine/threonine-protein kinase